MIGQATAHRRANAFAQALEGSGERESHAADRHVDPTQVELLATASALADVPKPDLDPEVKTVQRAQLIAAMEAAIADGTLDPTGRVPEQRRGPGAHRAVNLRRLRPRSCWSRRLAAGGLTVGVAAGALGGVAAASTNALPGDSLYGLKLGIEDLRLGMADDDADRGTVLLGMASTRMQEARRLMERGRSGPLDPDSVSEVGRALTGMHKEAAEGHHLLSGAYQRNGSLTPMEVLNDFSVSNGSTWTRLRQELPPQLHDVGTQVSSVFAAIDREVAPLQGLLPTSTGTGSHRRHGDTGTGNGGPNSGVADRSAPGVASHDGTSSHGKSAANPTPTEGLDGATQGLIGGGSGLLNSPSPNGSPSSPSGNSGSSQGSEPDVTIPPLLPGIMPSIGITGGETTK